MSVKPVRQVTPPAARIWLAGLGATALAAGANAGWLWICVNLFNWEIVVPEAFQSAVYVDASLLRVTVATAIAGIFATLVAVGLAKLFIGPRIWFLVIGLGGGLASVYGALTLTGVSFSVKFSLSVMHLLATFLVVLPIAEALKIRDSDLHRADVRYHEHLESKNSDDTTFIAGSTAATTSSAIDAPKNLNDTTVAPLDSPTPDASGSFDGGGSAGD
ncbi:unannotated protein [freshwater metagenome]|uniref:Unannotated protein n=1 Tax=freshwater metagenome TaxID=449393 RepID=A0A094QGE7_9ZZZZ|nr:hypothetical protein [Actinomycetota bacterium]